MPSIEFYQLLLPGPSTASAEAASCESTAASTPSVRGRADGARGAGRERVHRAGEPRGRERVRREEERRLWHFVVQPGKRLRPFVRCTEDHGVREVLGEEVLLFGEPGSVRLCLP